MDVENSKMSAIDWTSNPLALEPVSVEKAERKRAQQININDKIKNDDPKYHGYLQAVETSSKEYVKKFHEVINTLDLKCEELTSTNGSDGGVYRLIEGRKKGKTGQTSRPVDERVSEQFEEGENPFEKACLVASTEKCVEIMNNPKLKPYLVKSIELGRSINHIYDGHAIKEEEHHSRHLVETGIATCFKGYTHEVHEHLTNVPTAEIEKAVERPTIWNEDAIRVKNDSWRIVPAFTWEPLRSFLEEMKSMYMHHNHPDKFAQNHMTRRCYGESEFLEPKIDAVEGKDNPRAVELKGICDELDEHMTPDIVETFVETGEMPNDMNTVLGPILERIDKESGNRDGYKAPSQEVLGQLGGKLLLELSNKEYECRSDEVLIVVERELVTAIEEVDKINSLGDQSFTNQLFGGSKFHKQLRNDGVVYSTVVETSGDRPNFEILESSYHVIVGEDQKDLDRINAIQNYVATTASNERANIIAQEDFETEQALSMTFLKTLVGLEGTLADPKGSWRNARNFYTPPGFFNSHYNKGVVATANKLGRGGIGADSMVFLRLDLGQDKTNLLVTTLSDKVYSRTVRLPMDVPNWTSTSQKTMQRLYNPEFARQETEKKREHKEKRKLAGIVEKQGVSHIDIRTGVDYPPEIIEMLSNTAVDYIETSGQPYISTVVANTMFNEVLGGLLDKELVTKEQLDLRFLDNEEKQPKGRRDQYEKALSRVCDKADTGRGPTVWLSKTTVPKSQAVVDLQGRNHELASKAAAKAVASMTVRISGGGRTSNRSINTNKKVKHTFTETDLNHLEGWKRQKRADSSAHSTNSYYYYSPGDVLCQTIADVRKLVKEENESGVTKKRKRAVKQENTNEIEPCIFSEKQRNKILKDKETGQVYRLTDESKLSGWKQQKTVNKKATMFIAPNNEKKFLSMSQIHDFVKDKKWIVLATP